MHTTSEAYMSQDPLKKSDTITAAMRQQERLRDIVDPPALRAMRGTQERIRNSVDPPALRAMREAQERIRNVMDPPALRAMREAQGRIRDIVDPPALRAMREAMGSIRAYSLTMAETLLSPSQTAARTAEAFSLDLPDPPSLASMTTFARSAQLFGFGATVIEAALRYGNLDQEADKAALAAVGISKLGPQILEPNFRPSGKIIDAGIHFLRPSFANGTAELVAEMPSEVFRALDLDISLPGGTHDLVEKERIGLATKTFDELEAVLVDLDPELIALLHGARGAANSQNPDRARHLCISLRELLGHALRQLACDAEVSAWTQDSTHFHNGKPTRKARIQYLYSSVGEPSLRDFIAADIRTALELFDVLSNGTHIPNFGASAAALTILLNRAEGILLLLLRLASSRQT